MREVKHGPRLPREAVAAPSLEVFKARLDGALSTLGWWKMSLLMAGGVEPDDLQGRFQPKPFYDSMIVYQITTMIWFKGQSYFHHLPPKWGFIFNQVPVKSSVPSMVVLARLVEGCLRRWDNGNFYSQLCSLDQCVTEPLSQNKGRCV